MPARISSTRRPDGEVTNALSPSCIAVLELLQLSQLDSAGCTGAAHRGLSLLGSISGARISTSLRLDVVELVSCVLYIDMEQLMVSWNRDQVTCHWLYAAIKSTQRDSNQLSYFYLRAGGWLRLQQWPGAAPACLRREGPVTSCEVVRAANILFWGPQIGGAN